MYTFKNLCTQDPSLCLGDDTIKIFLTTCGDSNGISNELKAFLDYVGGSAPSDTFTQQLDEAVKSAKRNGQWRSDIMKYNADMQTYLAQGYLEGSTERNELVALRMYQEGCPMTTIMTVTELSEKEVLEIVKNAARNAKICATG